MSAEPCKGLSLLERLNNDVLTLILHELVAEDPCVITTLSLTSKRLRSVCLPTLFEKATLDCGRLPDSEPPNAAWPYIRTMDITGSFATSKNFDAGSLRQIIPRLTALRVIRFVRFQWGVTWDSLQFVLAAPNVRVLEIEEPFSAWRQTFTIPDGASSGTLQNGDAEGARTRPQLVLSKYSHPIATPDSRSSSSPFRDGAFTRDGAVEWPRLRELTLDGDHYYGDDPATFSRLCARMPRLRVLDLHLRHKVRSQT
ncbi:hypothetical protein EVG20_g11517, partial [Dentipellis fragilis]